MRLDGNENLRAAVDQWAEALGEVFESMAEQRPEVVWKAMTGSLTEIGLPSGRGSEEEVLWWEQPFQFTPEMVFWVGAPRATWEYAGRLTLKAAGVETIEPADAKSTWFEVLGQSLGSMARSLGAVLGREVTLGPGVERQADAEVGEWASVSLSFREAALAPLVVAMGTTMVNAILGAHSVAAEHAESVPETPGVERPRGPSRTMDLLMDVDLPVSISFGKTQLPLRDVLKLTTGSIVELNRGVNDQVEVLVNHCLIARGEVVVVEGNYGVRIHEISKRQDRLRGLE